SWLDWYPVSPAKDLKKDQPNQVVLLGLDLVVWWHQPSGTWSCFADECPHRLAPLSEGRIDKNGNLQCAYHGWEFSEKGSCERIPQDSMDTMKCDKKACATSYPGLLWIFPDTDRNLAMSKSPKIIPQFDDPAFVDPTNFFMRDVPYGWDTLIENLVDPSHVPFAHHGLIEARDQGRPINLYVESHEAGFEGYDMDQNSTSRRCGIVSSKFRPPCLISDPEKNSTFLGLGTYCIPTAPGHSRLITRFPFRFPNQIVANIVRMQPRWMTHLSQNQVIDSDNVFLSLLESKVLLPRSSLPLLLLIHIAATYYVPAAADRPVLAFRQWLQKQGGQPAWLGTPSMLPKKGSRRELLDRYEQHTKICSSCSR
ncbi:hypothetical protein GUITHDRAFT_50255, partial [Guillardia theta CCMP2712]